MTNIIETQCLPASKTCGGRCQAHIKRQTFLLESAPHCCSMGKGLAWHLYCEKCHLANSSDSNAICWMNHNLTHFAKTLCSLMSDVSGYNKDPPSACVSPCLQLMIAPCSLSMPYASTVLSSPISTTTFNHHSTHRHGNQGSMPKRVIVAGRWPPPEKCMCPQLNIHTP